MNNLENVLWTGFLFLLGMSCLYFLFADISTNVTNLDNESVEMISKFNDGYLQSRSANILYNSSGNYSGLPNYEGVAPEFRESAEAKASSTFFTGAWNTFIGFPTALLSTIPFVDDDAAEIISVILVMFMSLLGSFQLIGLYKAWRGGNTNN